MRVWKQDPCRRAHALPVLLVAVVALWAARGPAFARPSVPDVSAEIRAHLAAGAYRAAEAQARELLETAEASEAGSLRVAAALDLLAEALRRGGAARGAEALEVAERAVAIKRARLAPDDPRVAESLYHFGAVLYRRDELDAARAPLERALEIRLLAHGEDHPDVALSLILLGNLYFDLNEDFARVEELFERARRVQDRTLPLAHPDVAWRCRRWGSIQFKRRDYPAARVAYEQGLEALQATLPDDSLHPWLGSGHHGLGIVLQELGDLAGARERFERALEHRSATLGDDHPNVARSLLTLARLYHRLGDLEGARRRYERALEIHRTRSGQESRDLLTCLLSMGSFERDVGEPDVALGLYERSLTLATKMLGERHGYLASIESEIGGLLHAQGDFDAARLHYDRAGEIIAAADVSDPLELARLAHRRAYLALDLGAAEEARTRFEDALARLGEAFPEDSSALVRDLEGLAYALRELGEEEDAFATALRAHVIQREGVSAVAREWGERSALTHARETARGLDLALSIAATTDDTRRGDEALVPRAYDAVIRARSLVLEEICARSRSVRAAADPAIVERAGRLRAARDRVAQLTVQGPAGDQEAYRSAFDAAQEEKHRAANELALATAGSGASVGLSEVALALPANAVLVTYVRYEHGGTAAPAPTYVAFVLRAEEKTPDLVELGPAREIDDCIDRWTAHFRSTSPLDPSNAEAEAACRADGAALRERLWDPVARAVRDAALVFLVPDDRIHRVSFAALPASEGAGRGACGRRYLVETAPPVHYLATERDLAREIDHARGSGLLALGGPAFDVGPAGEFDSSREADDRARTMSGLRFTDLPESAREATAVAGVWNGDGAESRALVLTGEDAGEAEFKREAPGRRVLHLATHGFFLEDGSEAPESARGVPVSDGGATLSLAIPSENPLLRAGLAFAGANAPVRGEAEDGILTAEEVVGLDLSGVEWTVLSACDTGLGGVQSREGVLGLRRAFRVAGVQTLIMSLWPVEDRLAREWMEALYAARFREGLGTALAVREANLRTLRACRQRAESTHPARWSAFVAAGRWD